MVMLVVCADARDAGKDFDTLDRPGNDDPRGIWSDGATMWVADTDDDKIYAYDMVTKARDRSKDFNTLRSAGNVAPRGLWSDGTTMWVAHTGGRKWNWITLSYVTDDDKIYAYDLSTTDRNPARDFNTLKEAGNTSPKDIWSDGATMWVADTDRDKILAYDMVTKARDPAKDFDTLTAAGNTSPRGLWSDGTTLWVGDYADDKLYAYDMATRARDPARDFDTLTAAGNTSPRGLWSDGTTMWVADDWDDKLYAYSMSSGTPPPATQSQAPTDFNGDGRTDFADFFLFIDAYGTTDARFDLDGNGTVDFADFFEFIDAFDPQERDKMVAMARELIGLPGGTELRQNAPNPFNSETVISWSLSEPGPARVEVFALSGQRVAVLGEGPRPAGRHRIHWDGRDDGGRPLASGVYLYRLVSPGGVLTRKLTLLR